MQCAHETHRCTCRPRGRIQMACVDCVTNTKKIANHPITFRGRSALSAMWRLETDLGGGGLSRTLRLNRMRADSIPASLRLRGHLAATWRVVRVMRWEEKCGVMDCIEEGKARERQGRDPLHRVHPQQGAWRRGANSGGYSGIVARNRSGWSPNLRESFIVQPRTPRVPHQTE